MVALGDVAEGRAATYSDEISARLKLALTGQNLTKIAEESGIGHSLLRKYRDGTMPGADNLTPLCKALRISMVWLLHGVGPMWTDSLFPVDVPYPQVVADRQAALRPQELGGARESVPVFKGEPQQLDRKLLRMVITEAEQHLAQRKKVLAPEAKASLLAALYEIAVESEGRVSSETLHAILGLAQPKD